MRDVPNNRRSRMITTRQPITRTCELARLEATARDMRIA
jgi:hypothetical protein